MTHPLGHALRHEPDFFPISGVNAAIFRAGRPEWCPAMLFLWGIELMAGAGASMPPNRRQTQLRDGLHFATVALMGLGPSHLLRIGVEDGAAVVVAGADQQASSVFDLVRILQPWLDRYLRIERVELLNRGRSDAIWITRRGEGMGEIGFDQRLRWWSVRQFGNAGGLGVNHVRWWFDAGQPLLRAGAETIGLLQRISHAASRGLDCRDEVAGLWLHLPVGGAPRA